MKKTILLLLILIMVQVFCSCVTLKSALQLETKFDLMPVELVQQWFEEELEQIDDVSITVNYLCIKDYEYQKYHDFIFRVRERYRRPTEYIVSNGNKVIEDGENWGIYLLTNSGEKILLIEGDEDLQVYATYTDSGEGYKYPYIYKMIDDYRFIYAVQGWEWTWYCGLYDLRIFENYPFYSAGQNPILVLENTLFSIGDVLYDRCTIDEFKLSKTDLSTMITEMLLTDIPEDLIWDMTDYSISPDGKYFVILSRVSPGNLITNDTEFTVNLFSLDTGNFLCSYPLFGRSSYEFYSSTQLLLFSWEDDTEITLIEIGGI